MTWWLGHTDNVALKIEVYSHIALEPGVQDVGRVRLSWAYNRVFFPCPKEPCLCAWRTMVSIYIWFLLKRTLVILE